MKPRIAIPIPTTSDLPYNQRSWQNYADAVGRAGGEPVQVDLGLAPQQLRTVAETWDGICLPGSPADLNPTLYAPEVDPATAPPDPAREACDFFLLEHTQNTGKPVLAICYGVQSANVYFGGSLVQDLTPLPVNHSAGGQVAIAHTALVPEQSLLASLLTLEEAPAKDGFLRLPVNSSHHQAVGSPGENLRIVARCPDDGVIEAVEWPFTGEHPWFFLGVQWHPERSYDISAASRALFGRLVQEAAVSAGRR